ncbi:MAG: cytochrome c biogenesis protein CcsA [Flavobacteriaceae bacterium]|nr:cytochrome c biogenesis protein CcsA [Flavobacteriaceae bacterium]
MKEKIAKILFSTRLMAVLFIVFAVSMAVGTFLDAEYERPPSPYTNVIIYKSWWFELIMILFVINFIGNIFRFRLVQQKKWSVLTLHLSFILILLGAGITRYIGFEGVMPIQEGQSNNKILSDEIYLTAWVDGDVNGNPMRRKLEKNLILSERLEDGWLYNNHFKIDSDFNQQPFSIEYVSFKNGAEEVTRFKYDKEGERYLHFVESGSGHREDHYIRAGQTLNIHNVLVSFEAPEVQGSISIFTENDTLRIRSPFEGSRMEMRTQKQFEIKKDSVQNFELLSLHQLGGLGFVVPDNIMTGAPTKDIIYTSEATEDALTVSLSNGTESKEVTLLGGKGIVNEMKDIELGDLQFHLSYGSKEIDIPFNVQLNDLIAERYPGTDPNEFNVGFKSYESQVTILEEGKDPTNERIYMNNVLDRSGYRFFQASINFSTGERKTKNDPDITILSVNHDFWGTWVTYIGYFLLYLGLMLILFDKKTRFGFLERQLSKIKEKKKTLSVIVILLMTGFASAQNMLHEKLPEQEVIQIIQERAFPKEEAAKFGELMIQDVGGRFKPVNTYASELLRKVSKRDTYHGLDANQALLSMIQNPRLWFDAPVIKLKRGNDSIRKILELPLDAKYAAISDFFTGDGQMKVTTQELTDASSTNKPNAFQKDLKRFYQDQQLLSQALTGSLIRIYPIPGDDNDKWVSPLEIQDLDFGPQSEAIKLLFPSGYFDMLIKKDYDKADKILVGLKELQKAYSGDVLPSEDKIKTEITYNRIDIFKKLYRYYLLFGGLMFFFLIWQIFLDKKFIRAIINLFKGIMWLLFLTHVFGLIVRSYLSGHAPWSDAYESMIYVAAATMLFGLLFGRKSNMTIASTTFVVSMILFFAHENWVDPAIANLQPVLDSYWLMIHVAVIVGSYGPFGLAAILGLVTLLLMMLTTKKNKERMNLNVKELMTIIEMAMTIGLVMLTIGNFLGGQWANESWGRYWGWDPKETWALISIMVYAFVIHMRLVPGLKSRWLFALMSVLAFGSVLMTYFGVNFWLTGLHSYASGDQIISVDVAYQLIGFVIAFGLLAYFTGYKRHYIK